ncbi:hypothetical protein AC1031_011425 [Aphanomyces cochlioides]|nr:hypothetical protein AC1031_011425 [Aphanomyces cochlioides]
MDENSQIHLCGIAMYYPDILARFDIDLTWLRLYTHPKASLYYKATNEDEIIQSLSHWKDTCTPSILFEIHDCTLAMLKALFCFPDVNRFLREVKLITSKLGHPQHCVINEAVAYNFVIWIMSNPIESLKLINFSWESPNLLRYVVTEALDSPILRYFEVAEASVSNMKFHGLYHRQRQEVAMKFYDYICQSIPNIAIFTVLVDAFRLAILTKSTILHLRGLPQSTFPSLNLEDNYIVDDDVIRMAPEFHHLENVVYLSVYGNPAYFEGMKTLVLAAPLSVRTIVFADSYNITRWFNTHQYMEMRKLFDDRSIKFITTKQDRILYPCFRP